MGNYLICREEPLTIGNCNIKYAHNERHNNTYLNQDIDLSVENYHFVKPVASYKKMFDFMVDNELFSTRHIQVKKAETKIGSEILVAVGGKYFRSREEAISFYEDVNAFLHDYFSVELPDGRYLFGGDLCLSSVIHFDEKQPFEDEGYISAHLHYTTCCCVAQEHFAKRTKKQMKQGKAPKSEGWHFQLSHRSFWQSGKDEQGKLYFSYSKINDEIVKFMKSRGYDILRGEKGSTSTHLHPNQLKALYEKIEDRDRKLILDIDSSSKDDDGNILVPESEWNKIINVQKSIGQQKDIINKSQTAIDKEKAKNKEDRYKNKKKELELEAADNANSNRPREQIEKELIEAEKKIKAQEVLIRSQQSAYSILQGSFEALKSWTRILVDKVKRLIKVEMSEKERRKLFFDIDKQCDELGNMFDKIEEKKNR